jgi:hypothetical protein
MRRTPLWVGFGVVVLGCAVSRSPMPAPPATPVRGTLIDSARSILEKNLRGEGWEAEVTDTSKQGQCAINQEEEWDENSAWVTFTARRPGGGATLLTPVEAAAVLKGVRADVRRLVLGYGGEVLDATEGEAYRERTLTVPYRIDKVAGTARVRIGAATDRPEETANRLDVVVREQAVK